MQCMGGGDLGTGVVAPLYTRERGWGLLIATWRPEDEPTHSCTHNTPCPPKQREQPPDGTLGEGAASAHGLVLGSLARVHAPPWIQAVACRGVRPGLIPELGWMWKAPFSFPLTML